MVSRGHGNLKQNLACQTWRKRLLGVDSEKEIKITVTWNFLKSTDFGKLAGIVSKEGIPAFVFEPL